MPHPYTSDLSASLRRTVLNTHCTVISPSASSSIPNFTPSHTPNTRMNHGTANRVSLGIHDIRPGRVSNMSRTYHETPNRSKHPSSPMISRTLSSGHLLVYLRDASLTDRTLEELLPKLGPVGFDIEYRPNFVKGRPLNRTALVQLASDSVVLLVQVSAMSTFPESLRRILEDPTIIKAGVGIRGDADKLWQDFGIKLAGFLELSYLARVVDPQWAATNGLISLTRLVKAYEDRDLKKPKSIQLSNWESSLTDKQQDYAARDATAALSVLRGLYAILPSIQPPPDQSLYLF